MQTAATPKWFPSHLAVNSGHVANGEEIVRTWEAIGERHASVRRSTPPHCQTLRRIRETPLTMELPLVQTEKWLHEVADVRNKTNHQKPSILFQKTAQ